MHETRSLEDGDMIKVKIKNWLKIILYYDLVDPQNALHFSLKQIHFTGRYIEGIFTDWFSLRIKGFKTDPCRNKQKRISHYTYEKKNY